MSQHQLGIQMFPMELARVLDRGLCSDLMTERTMQVARGTVHLYKYHKT